MYIETVNPPPPPPHRHGRFVAVSDFRRYRFFFFSRLLSRAAPRPYDRRPSHVARHIRSGRFSARFFAVVVYYAWPAAIIGASSSARTTDLTGNNRGKQTNHSYRRRSASREHTGQRPYASDPPARALPSSISVLVLWEIPPRSVRACYVAMNS